MRKNEKITRQTLLTQLQAIHPADILGGIWTIRDFALNEFHAGADPNGKNEHTIFKEAAEQWAYGSSRGADFDSVLKDYTQLLTIFAAYLSGQGMIEAQSEITRIQLALADTATGQDSELNFVLAEAADGARRSPCPADHT